LRSPGRARRLPNTFHPDISTIPAVPGAYGLVIRLDAPLVLTRPKGVLAPGIYLYCGSANGPGGLKARLGRHLRKDKSIRWHVDHLTNAGQALGAWVVEGGDECALVEALHGLAVPLPGFGSSDCRTCPSHLLRWPDGSAVMPYCNTVTEKNHMPLPVL
jgi:Uri superfamily endonuclease